MSDDILIAHGGAGINDTHLLADVVAIDEEIIDWLELREKRRRRLRPARRADVCFEGVA